MNCRLVLVLKTVMSGTQLTRLVEACNSQLCAGAPWIDSHEQTVAGGDCIEHELAAG